MSLSTAATEADVISRIKTVFPAGRIYDVEVPDTSPTPQYPYVVLYWGEPVQTGGGRHITGVRNDVMVGYLTVQVISTDDASANALKDVIKGALVGYRPTDSGEMVPAGGTRYSRAATSVRPTLFYRELGFIYRTNLSGA